MALAEKSAFGMGVTTVQTLPFWEEAYVQKWDVYSSRMMIMMMIDCYWYK